MGTTAVNPGSFTGSSAFSSDLQQVIARAVGIASLPLTQLQTEQSTLTGQQNELQTVSSQFRSLQTALDGINNALGLGSYGAVVSNESVLSASVSTGVSAGSYTVAVSNIGSQTNTLSNDGLVTVTNPSSQNIDISSTYTLRVNGQSFQLTDSSDSLNGLAQGINTSGASVQATIVNVGSSSAPDYRLSIQSLNYAPDTIQLSDGSKSLLQTLGTGSYVTYQVDGQPSTPINSSSRTLTISPGLSVNVAAAGTSTVTVSQTGASVSSALNTFASAYNTIIDELAKSRGQNGGALTGQSIVYSLSSALTSLANYTSTSGGVQSPSDLGLSFDQTGHLQFDSTAFSQISSTSLNAVLNFLGSKSGGGFLQAAGNILTSITDPTNGLLPQETQSLSSEASDLTQKINSDQDQVNQLQQTLTQQMASADATISNLEQQVTEITNLFSAMQTESRAISG
ncbi:MAG: flagellar filament capping protein FliD [Acidobacteriaceae bacterium]|nr:flagellar filament capping protein FliD [Acidobacteriaceae bacterium]